VTASQPGILAAGPVSGRYLTFTLMPGGDARKALHHLAAIIDGEACVAGLGEPLLRALGRPITDMQTFPRCSGDGFEVPSTPAALWCWLRGSDRGDLFHRSRLIEKTLAEAFVLDNAVDAYRHDGGRDLTGYEDGTENPHDDAAIAAAIVQGHGIGLDGASFAAVQQWVHNFDRFGAMTRHDQDNAIGRRKSDNEELADAPESSHVKRTAQETFAPEAFVVRRSMPWNDATRAGLMFVAFGHTPAAFAAQLNRMVGAEDGVIDALFGFSRPVTGAYYWCPPMLEGRLDLTAVC